MSATLTAHDPTTVAAFEMLTEGTGRHLLDSGGAYGRNWERHASRVQMMQEVGLDPVAEYANAAPATLAVDGRWGLEVTLNAFHLIANCLEYVEADDEAFRAWDQATDPDQYWHEAMEGFVAMLDSEARVTGLYGDGDPITVNTYNHESLLSQVVQYTMFAIDRDVEVPHTDHTLDEGVYVFLQVHGGCDVRGGYTRPRLFRLAAYEEGDLLSYDSHASIGCSQCHARWWTDDAYHWYGDDREVDLSDVEFVDEDEEQASVRHWVREVLEEHDERDLLEAFPPKLGPSLTCPECNDGVLSAHPSYF